MFFLLSVLIKGVIMFFKWAERAKPLKENDRKETPDTN